MEVTICVPLGADISALEKEYPNIWQDEGWDDHDRYFVGKSEEDAEGDEDIEIAKSFLTYTEAVECCGFCEGAIEGCNTLLEGNGAWAQGLLGRLDFKRMAMSLSEKRQRMRMSRLWIAAKKRGEAAKAACVRLTKEELASKLRSTPILGTKIGNALLKAGYVKEQPGRGGLFFGRVWWYTPDFVASSEVDMAGIYKAAATLQLLRQRNFGTKCLLALREILGPLAQP